MMASLLRQDAITIMKAALAGTRTDQFIDVLEAAFMGEESKLTTQASNPLGKEEEDKDQALEALLTEHSQVEEGASTSTLSTALKCKMPLPLMLR